MKTLTMLCVVVAVTMITGCRKQASQSTNDQSSRPAEVETLQLTEDGPENLEAVAAYVPNGMDKEKAVERMTKAGFTCQVIEGGRVTGVEPTTEPSPIKVGDTMSVIICDKQPEGTGGKSYKVILHLDSAGKVKSRSISQ